MEEKKYSKWVFTWNNDNVVDLSPDIEKDHLEKILSSFCKSYVFQVERETRTHYQGCFVTKVRKRKSTILALFKQQLEPTNQESFVKNLTIERMMGSTEDAVAYCTKTDSRIDTPVYNGSLMPYTASDLKIFDNPSVWYPWQKQMAKILFKTPLGTLPIKMTEPDDRTLIWVVDQLGCSGKSKFVKHICYNLPEQACKLAFGSSTQLRSACISAGPRQVYFIDMPRTLGRDDNILDIISTAEDIKNGFIVTSMYGLYKSLIFEPPHVVIFSNTWPPNNTLSADRWDVYLMIDDKTLLKQPENDIFGHFGPIM